MKSQEPNDFSFEGVARAARRDALRLTPAQRVARSIELQALANRFKAAGQRAKSSDNGAPVERKVGGGT